MTYIYALIDPRTEQPYYVGKTTQAVRREQQHLETKPTVATLLLLNEGVQPRFTILQRYSFDTDLDMMESAWISRFRDRGIELVNERYHAARFVNDETDFEAYLEVQGKRVLRAGKPFAEPVFEPDEEPEVEDNEDFEIPTYSLPPRRRRRSSREVTEEEKRAIAKIFDVPI